MASAEIIALLNSDSEGDDPAPFGVDASLVQGWQPPNAAGTSAFQAIDVGSDNSDDEPFPDREAKAPPTEKALSGKSGQNSFLHDHSSAAGGGSSDGSDGSGASNGLLGGEGKGADQLRESKVVSSMLAAGGGVGSDSEENAEVCELDDSPNPFSGAGSDSPAYSSSEGHNADAGSPGGSNHNERGKEETGIEDRGHDVHGVHDAVGVGAEDGLDGVVFAGVEDGLDVLEADVGPGQLEGGGAVEEWGEAKIDVNEGGLAEDDHEHAALVGGGAGERGNDPAEEEVREHEEANTEVRQGVDEALAPEEVPEGGASASSPPAPGLPVEAQGVGEDVVDGEFLPAVSTVPTVLAVPAASAVSAVAAPTVNIAALEESLVAPVAIDEVAQAPAVEAASLEGSHVAPVAIDHEVQPVESGTAKAAEGEGLNAAGGLAEGGGSAASAAILAVDSPEAKSVAESPAESMESIIDALPPGFVRCPGCPMVYELVPNEDAARGGGGGVSTKELPKGANLSRRAATRHNGRHRFRCPSCSACFCGSCRAMPYHIGFDCAGWAAHQAKPKCTYCGDAAEEQEPVEGSTSDSPGQEVLEMPPCCGANECRERANEGCRKKLDCGHPCRGPGAGECLPCIEPGCPSAELDGDAEYCNVCWTESLLAAPCVKLECGHFVHVSCGREQLERGRPTARLTFGFMSCPVCRADKALATHPHLAKGEGIAEQLTLASEVEELAVQRLRADELPPLQRSSMESLQARMRRRMAGLARHRQLDGNPAHWRARGRGGPFPLHMPYPPAYPALNPPRRVRAAGRAAAVLSVPRPGGPGGPGEWQPFVGLGADWGIPPFVPRMPPPFPHKDAGAGAGAGVGAGAGGGALGGRAGAAGGAGDAAPGSQEDYLSRKRAMLIAQADVAMARVVAGGGARAPPGGAAAAQRAQGRALDQQVLPAGRLPAGRDRMEKHLAKGRAIIVERRRARLDAAKELENLVMEEDWPFADGFAYRSRRSREALRAPPPAAGRGADVSLGENGHGDRKGDANGKDDEGGAAVEPRRPLRGDEWVLHDALRRDVRDLGDDPAGWPAALRLRLDPPIRRKELDCRKGGSHARRRRIIVEEGGPPGGELQGGRVDGGDGDDDGKKLMGVWGWGAGNGWWGAEAGELPDDLQPSGRGRKRRIGDLAARRNPEGGSAGGAGAGDGAAEGAGAGAGASDSAEVVDHYGCSRRERAKVDLKRGAAAVAEPVDHYGCSRRERPKFDLKRGAAAAAEPPANGFVDGWERIEGIDEAAQPWHDVSPWPLRAIAAKPPVKHENQAGRMNAGVLAWEEPHAAAAGDNEDDEVVIHEGVILDDEVMILEEGDLGRDREKSASAAIIPSSSKKKRKAVQMIHSEPLPPPSPPSPPLVFPNPLLLDSAVAPLPPEGDNVKFDAHVVAAVGGDGRSQKEGAGGGRSRDGGDDAGGVGSGTDQGSPAAAGGNDRAMPRPKRVHFAAGFKRGRQPYALGRDPLLPFFGGERGGPGVGAGAGAGAGVAPAYGRWGEKEEEEAANSVADAVRAAAKMAASEEPARGLQGMLARNYPRGDKIDLAAQGMLKLHVAPDSAAAAAPEGRNGGRAGVGADALGRLPNGAPGGPVDAGRPGALNGGVAGVPPGGAATKESKEAEGAAAGPPAPEQTKEHRPEMVRRALKKYSFYQCHSCRKPYFGGLVSCEPAAPSAGAGGGSSRAAAEGGGAGGAAGEAAAAERALADIKPQELLCGKCSAGSGGATCSEHGQEFMEHKCYWCCRKVASYFCGGVMHFCDVCHLHGFAAKPKSCLGGSRCLFGGNHPAKARNGQDEYILGCGICRPKPEEDASMAPDAGQ